MAQRGMRQINCCEGFFAGSLNIEKDRSKIQLLTEKYDLCVKTLITAAILHQFINSGLFSLISCF
jgi:hypothetical protein